MEKYEDEIMCDIGVGKCNMTGKLAHQREGGWFMCLVMDCLGHIVNCLPVCLAILLETANTNMNLKHFLWLPLLRHICTISILNMTVENMLSYQVLASQLLNIKKFPEQSRA